MTHIQIQKCQLKLINKIVLSNSQTLTPFHPIFPHPGAAFCLADIARNINPQLCVQSMFKRSVQQQLLSYHYRNRPAKSTKLNLFGKAIAVIDRLQQPQSLASIQELDLSHNGISEIQNIEQFGNAEFINLSHNRIVDHEEILKLQKLARLDTLYLKGNPFLREKMDRKVIGFLLSLNTDVEILSAESSKLVNMLAAKTLQNLCYAHYLRRIENHIELMNNYQVDEGFLSPDYAIFPKIKKIFEQNTKELSIKRQIIEAIEQRCFEDEGIVTEYMKNRLQAVENERSEIIRKIYQRQQLLRNVRSTYKQRVVPKKVIPRPMNGTVVVGYFSPPKLKESRKQAKIQDRASATKPRARRDDIENSPPPRRLSESIDWREGNQQQAIMNHLIKMNPLYHLLHSPLPSLKSHEKELLIQNLTLHLKEKLKELQKLQKKQYEYNRTKAEMNDLQEHLREMSVEFKNEQAKSQEKLKKLSTLCKEQSERVQMLCNQLTNCQQQLECLKAQNARIRDQNTQLKQKLALYQSQEDLQEAIKDHFSRNLKQKYIRLFSKKAHHLNQLKRLRCINQRIQQRQLKEKYFGQLIISSQLSKHQKLLIRARKNRLFKEFINQAKSSRTTTIKQEAFLHKIYQTNQRHLLSNLQKNHKYVMARHQKIEKFKKNTGKCIKANVFNVLKQLLEERYEESYNQSVERQSANIKMRKAFKIWKIFINQHEKRMMDCQALVKRGCKRYCFNRFAQRCKADLIFLASTHALTEFLQKMRKINSYFNFTKSTSSTIQQRRLKSRKVQLIRQHQYFFWFTSTIRDCRVKKRILVQKELQQKRLSEEERRRQEDAEKGVKDKRKLTFANVLAKMGSKVVAKILDRYKATMEFQRQRQQASVREFLGKLRTSWIEEYKLSTKVELLRKSPVISSRLKDVFICISSSKTKIQTFQCKSSRDKLLKCFYRWKFYNSWSKMQQYKHLYQELGPEISHVSQLQREVGRERELLMLQMEEKERMVRDWQRKCEEYEYILHSKDMKYEKLKDIYADMVAQQEMNATVKTAKEKESDMYLKYMPSEFKLQPTKYSFPGKTEDYLKGRTQSQLDNFKPDAARQTSAYLKNRESFLSSFKRF